jgi:hypothetical protein
MRCAICSRPDAKQINLELLQRTGRRSGSVSLLAKRLGVHRASLWRHRKEHLKIYVSKIPPKLKDLSFEERARLLAMDADRLQCQSENGLPTIQFEQGMRALALRVKLLEMESRFAGRPMTQKRDAVEALEDPEELERARLEYEELSREPEIFPVKAEQ